MLAAPSIACLGVGGAGRMGTLSAAGLVASPGLLKEYDLGTDSRLLGG